MASDDTRPGPKPPWEVIVRLLVTTRLVAFVSDMRAAGIHLGIGIEDRPATCVTCGAVWPCALAQAGGVASRG